MKMPLKNEIIDALNNNDKVSLVYNTEEQFEGFVHAIDEENLTINEFVSNIFRTFKRINIIEIEKI